MSTTPMTICNGQLSSATWLSSPNKNLRPTRMSKSNINGDDDSKPNANANIDPAYINTIVIHNISLPPNEFGQTDVNGLHYVKALFTNKLDWDAHPYFQTIKGAEVSAHLFIERDGAITQFVNFEERAWHAGKSSYLGRPECNDYSIGIELEGSDFTAFTDIQYKALSEVIIALYKAYPKTRRHLTGHSDIAPGRKTDPGDYFDWALLRERIAKKLNN
ncbi:1,6-anhydro-N-acetylmuramyl-L-alanine amidase AmpD [Psychrobacter sp. 1U2]|uniref:1,6-anhydro-N-acetylmuramyl-L-alanine amidase AmpD n=1 Tax=Psychrobacter sp. 1U2 TaxID=3453577 RepID=UPI003F4751F2